MLGSVYYLAFGVKSPGATVAFSTVASLVIVGLGLRRQTGSGTMRFALILVGISSLVTSLTGLTKTQLPPFVSSFAMVVAVVGAVLGVFAYLIGRNGSIASA
jgi:hypothetical protein